LHIWLSRKERLVGCPAKKVKAFFERDWLGWDAGTRVGDGRVEGDKAIKILPFFLWQRVAFFVLCNSLRQVPADHCFDRDREGTRI
jgi:hypothetical protein